jgi:hypothetical protein
MKSLAAAVLSLACALSAQELPEKPQPQPRPQPKSRVMWLIPTYDLVTKDAPAAPLGPRDKFRLFTESSFDRFTVVTAGFDAAINQALDTPEGYGQGMEGYGKRYGAAVADKVTSDFFKTYLYASLFRQDPRYFVMTASGGKNSKARRVGYAISRVFVTRGDNSASAAASEWIWHPTS